MRVNNREYTSDTAYTTEEQARDKAAESAYMICRNFSVNDGMYPGQKQGQAGVKQGLPVAIGTGRKGRGSSATYGPEYASSAYVNYAGTSSGGSSPRSSDSELEMAARRSSSGSAVAAKAEVCYCRRGYVHSHQRCAYCLREGGWY